mgnify:CR=1 FL=1
MADAAGMIFVWRKWVMYGRKISARTGRPISGEIASRMRAVNFAGLIEPIKWLASMAGWGETMPVRYKWIDRTDRRVLSVRNGLSDRKDRNGPDATNLASVKP